MRARIDFCDSPDGTVVIRDTGHDQGRPSVTNDAEAVVETILRIIGRLGEPPDTRIFYYDSDGTPGELAHDGQRFVGFRPWAGSNVS